MICTDGLRSSQASVIGKKLCQEANQQKTRSARARISRSIATKLALRLWT
jgi:hypothetical protein